MDSRTFYDEYWHDPSTGASENGILVLERQKRLKDILRALPTGARILDAGCGSGLFTKYLSDLGFNPVGIDISLHAIDYARYHYPQLKFNVTSLESELPFRAESFDAIWSTEVLEHLFDVSHALTEMSRVLLPHGVLILTTPYHGLLKNVLISMLSFDKHFDPDGSHIRFFTRGSLARCLESAGFDPEAWHGIGRFWPAWMSHFVIARKAKP